MGPIAIISALHDELAEVLALIPGQRIERVAGRDFWRGRIAGHEVVAGLSGIGKVAAATTASVLLDRYRASRLIFTGVAGGLGERVAVGDIVVGARFLQHDLDASPIFPRHEVPGYGRSSFDADAGLAQALQHAAQDAVAWLPAQLDAATRDAFGLRAPGVHLGLIASGDRFVSSAAESGSLRAELPGALAVDMESAAVAQVCHDFGIAFGAVRTVSDRADDQAHLDFPAFLQRVARRYSARVVAQALSRLDRIT